MNKEQGISHMERVRLKSTTTKISKKQEAHTSAPQNTPALTLAQHILHLQRTVGNRAVGRLVQAKLAVVGQDIYYGGSKSPTDLSLTAHEVTHVVQQDGEQLQRARTQTKEGAATGGA